MLKQFKYLAAKAIDNIIVLVCDVGLYHTNRNILPMQSGSKVLLIALDYLGDVVMGTPLIEALKSAFPPVEVTVLTRPSNAAVFWGNPFIGKVLVDDAPWWSVHPVIDCLRPSYWKTYLRNVRQLRREQYDVIIDLRGDLRHLLLFGAAARPRYLFGYGRTGGEALLSAIVPYDDDMHEIDKKLALLNPIGIEGIRPKPKIWLSLKDLEKARGLIVNLIGTVDPPLVLIDPGAKPIQQWPTDRFASVARRMSHELKRPLLVSAGPAYSHLAQELVSTAGCEAARLIGDVTIRELAAILAVCDLVISSDTGVAHIASAVGTPTVTLYGPTDPERFWHGAEGARVIQGNTTCCTPDLHHVCRHTESGKPGLCMLSISEDSLVSTLLMLLDRFRAVSGQSPT